MSGRCTVRPQQIGQCLAGGGHCTAGAYGALEQPSEDQQCGKKKRAQAGRTKVCMLKSLLLKGIRIIMSCMLTQFSVGYNKIVDEESKEGIACVCVRACVYRTELLVVLC